MREEFTISAIVDVRICTVNAEFRMQHDFPQNESTISTHALYPHMCISTLLVFLSDIVHVKQ